MAYLYTQQILDTECIGNSLNDKINPNFLSLDNTVQSLSATTQSLTNNLRTDVNSVSGQVYAAGSILQVVYLESSARQNIASADISQITDLQATITPKKSGSKILLQAMINSNGVYVSSFGFLQQVGASFVRIGGVTNTNSSNAIATTYDGGATTTTGYMFNTYITHLHTPSYTLGQSLVYAPGACSSWSGTTYTLRINDRVDNDMLSVSTITLFEIA